ncbi:MAG: glutathione S-transferase C-terminal domain-containing protein, partial [Byssovorax sp.]
GDKLDARLTPAQRAQGHALRRMTEEGLYFPMLYSRWIDEAGFAVVAPVFFAGIPRPLRPLVGMVVRRNTRKVLHAQGTGRHSTEQVYAQGKADLQALSDALGQQPFFLGDEPTSYDAAIYGIVQNLIAIPTGTPLTTFATSLPNLVAFCERMTKRCFEGEGAASSSAPA